MNLFNISLAWRAFGVVCLLLLVVGVYALYQRENANRYFETKTYYEQNNDSLLTELSRKLDKQGRETVVYRPIPLSDKVLKDIKMGLAAELRDQLRKEFGRNARLLYGQRTATTTIQQLPTVLLRDTLITRPFGTAGPLRIKAKAGTFKDEWLNLTGIVTGDSLSVNYSIRNEMTVRAYSRKDKKYWFQFWKPRKVFVDLKNANPNTTSPTMEAVVVEKE